MTDWIMKGILGTLAVLVMLVGCQTARTYQLKTPAVNMQAAPASLYMEEPKPAEPVPTGDATTDTILMFRKACIDKKAFWIKIANRTEQYICERVDNE